MSRYLMLAYTALGACLISPYFEGRNLNFCLGLLAIGASVRLDKSRRGGTRFAYVAFLFSLLAWRYPLWTIKYAALTTGLLFLVEYRWGRVNRVVLLTVVAMMPVLDFFADVFSFPVRLALTGWVGKMLAATDARVVIAGNTITYNGTEFSVDPACMGLHMLVAAYLAGLMLVGHYEKKGGKALRPGWLMGIGLLVLPLDIVSNLFRMLTLVYFRILPESDMHGIVGLICFAAYVLGPLAVVAEWVVRKKGAAASAPRSPESPPAIPFISRVSARDGLPWLIPFFALLSVWLSPREGGVAAASGPSLAGFTYRDMPDHITQLQNGDELIYIKPLSSFCSTEHHPMLCWTGSGYTFQHVQMTGTVYTAVLEKKTEHLYTAWWYDNGIRTTTSQAVWRWDMFCGAPSYALVNVSASSPQALDRAIAFLMRKDVRARLFGKNLLNHTTVAQVTGKTIQ